ncbi:hypothetical protein [Streptomyces galbus]|uniref:Uncharacterized protein n=1 Tax=Streptomyces galbus TaxID=33898 RepID=A0A4U5X259_STRGB|nr:hypothetical protein [Streptomyces galbus]TKT09095.1 hypothetical protein E4U92_16105 [Streptomyces galbus]GHD26364.1 hypothetical protein GCM10010335_12680 [Streptomyces galbus]
MISAVVIPLLLLAAVFAPGLYEDWKTHARRTRLPLPPTWPSLRTRLRRAAGAGVRHGTAWAAERIGGARRPVRRTRGHRRAAWRTQGHR